MKTVLALLFLMTGPVWASPTAACGAPGLPPPKLSANPSSFMLTVTQSGAAANQSVTLQDIGATQSWTSTASSSGNWLSINPTASSALTNATSENVSVIGTPGSLAPGNYNGSITITPNACGGAPGAPTTISVMLVVSAPPSVSVSAGGSASLVAGGSTQAVGITLTRTNYTGGVTLSLGALPTGVSASISQPGTGSSGSMSLQASANAPVVSNQSVTVTASGSGVTSASTNFSISVSMVPASITLNALSNSVSLQAGGGGQAVGVTLNRINYSGSVSISLSGLPAGVTTPSISQPDTASSGSITLQAAANTAAVTNQVVTMTASGSSVASASATFLLSVVAAPVLSVSTGPIAFSANQGSNPSNQTFQVQNTGGGSLSWSATASSTGNWLSVSPASGTAPSTVTVSVASASLAAGSYTGSISVSSPGVQSSPQTISVTLSVTQQAQPILSVTPGLLNFSATAGTNPTPQSFAVQNTGSGSLAWSASITSGSAWLSLSTSAGTAPSTVTVSVNSATLPAGTYNGSIGVTSTAAGSKSVPVTLTIPPTSTLAPDINSTYALTFSGTCASSFYETDATLNAGQQQGVYSMIVSINQGLLAGGFNLGGGFGASGTMPGFGQFQTSNLAAGAVNIQIQAQPLSGTAVDLIVTVLNASNNNSLVYMTSGPPPLNFNTPVLAQSTYYTVAVSSAAGSPSGTFQMSMATASGLGGFQGGVVAGGMAIAGVTGYGAFCLPISQPVSIKLQTGSTFGTAAAGVMTMTMKNKTTGQVFPPSP